MRQYVDAIVTVEEDEIMQAVELVFTRAKQVVEPSGAVTLAAAINHKLDLDNQRVVAIASGGNIDLNVLCRWLATREKVV